MITAMCPDDWTLMEKHGHFNRNENWGDSSRMSTAFVFAYLWPLRRGVAKSIHVNNASEQTGHSRKSMHKQNPCSVIDGYINIPLIDQATALIEYDFDGIGIYPEWNTPGFHADKRTWYGLPKVYWIRHSDRTFEGANQKGDYHYFADVDKFLNAVRGL